MCAIAQFVGMPPPGRLSSFLMPEALKEIGAIRKRFKEELSSWVKAHGTTLPSGRDTPFAAWVGPAPEKPSLAGEER